MNKKENSIINENLREAAYQFKLSLRESKKEVSIKYYHLEKLIELMNNLNVEYDKDILKLDKDEFMTLMTSYGHTDINYHFSISDLLYGDFNQLLNDINNTGAWDKLNLLLDKALLHGLIDNIKYELVKDMINEYV